MVTIYSQFKIIVVSPQQFSIPNPLTKKIR